MKSWWLFSFSQAQACLKACENEKSLNTPEAYWLLLKASPLGWPSAAKANPFEQRLQISKKAQACLKACENEKSLNTPEAYWLLLKASPFGMAERSEGQSLLKLSKSIFQIC